MTVGRERAVAAAVATLAGVSIFLIASTVFAYHSVNHDEGVYLFQAAMLLEGDLELYAGDLAGAFRPWFFVEDGGRLYPKYTPVPAAMYAVSMALFGEPRVTLAAVAAGNAALVYLLGATAFDRRVGIVAAVLFAASPLALVTTSVFLPYAPTTLLNLAFAVAYLRGVRNGSRLAAAAAGVAIGLAFFARPYTAVLFAAPFVLHAAVRALGSIREASPLPGVPEPAIRHGITALGGLLFVGVALAYNLRMTGSALLFPYEAFAPLDGPGFGRRRILAHSIEYTPELAVRSNAYGLWYFLTRWYTAGPIGVVLAAAGACLAAVRWRRGKRALGGSSGTVEDARFERTAGLLLAGVAVSVIVGNLFFWGTHNALATMGDPTNGLVSQFGPFYHFDLLVPLSAFGGLAAIAGGRALPRVRDRLAARLSRRTARGAVVAGVAVALIVAGVTTASLVATPVERNAAHAEKYDRAYGPIDDAAFDNDLVFIPTPYGDWQHHPFQYLRNEPGLDGDVVYALDRGSEGDFAVIDAYPDRDLHRYAYRGEWTANADRHVVPKLEALTLRSGTTLSAETTVGVPEEVERVRVRLETERDDGHAEYAIPDPGETVDVRWSIEDDATWLAEDPDAMSVSVAGVDTVVVTVTLVQPDGSTLTYRQEVAVRETDSGVEAIWPPERTICPLVMACGTEGTYLGPDDHPEWTVFETDLEAEE